MKKDKKRISKTTASRPSNAPVLFECKAERAQTVHLAGSCNNWSDSATPMKRGADGIWSVALELTPGSYQYKFVIDGEWCCSPELLPHPPAQAVECVPNDFGTLNFTTEVAVGPA